MATNYKIEVRFLYGAPKRYEALMVKRLSEEQHKTVRARPYRPISMRENIRTRLSRISEKRAYI
jgi:hypothetical protein